MRYKQRDYSQQVSLTEKAIAKANTKVRVLQSRVGRYTFTMQAASPPPSSLRPLFLFSLSMGHYVSSLHPLFLFTLSTWHYVHTPIHTHNCCTVNISTNDWF